MESNLHKAEKLRFSHLDGGSTEIEDFLSLFDRGTLIQIGIDVFF